MGNWRSTKAKASEVGVTERDRALQVLALEYQALRAEILMQASARYQFLGFLTAAAALLATGIGRSFLGLGTWVLAGLAGGVFVFGVICFRMLGQEITRISARVAEIENRINGLVPAQPGTRSFMSWESDHQNRTRLERLVLALGFSPKAKPGRSAR
jgi:hypothetical protein